MTDAILTAATDLATVQGWRAVTRDRVAEWAGVATGTVNHRWGSIAALRDAVMGEAVRLELIDVVAAGLADGHPAARAAPETLRRAALERLV